MCNPRCRLAMEFLMLYPQYKDLWELAVEDCTGEIGTDYETAQKRFAEFLDNNGVIHFIWDGDKEAFRIALLRKRFMEKDEIDGSDFEDLLAAYGAKSILDYTFQRFLLKEVFKVRRDSIVMKKEAKDTPVHDLYWKAHDELVEAISKGTFRCPNCQKYTGFLREGSAWYFCDTSGQLTACSDGPDRAIPLDSMECRNCHYRDDKETFRLPPHEMLT